MNPYNVDPLTLTPGFESTKFITSAGQEFVVYLRDISAFGKRIFDFAFEPVGAELDGDFPVDVRMGDTIAVILDEAFCNGKDIIVYAPHENDPRRIRKFNIWYAKHQHKMKCGKLERDSVTFIIDTNTEVTLCFLFKPDCASIIQHVIATGDFERMWEEKA
ncbi:MAG TPA: hypothetical protein VF490_05860 [Chryseosolibacter sp.]